MFEFLIKKKITATIMISIEVNNKSILILFNSIFNLYLHMQEKWWSLRYTYVQASVESVPAFRRFSIRRSIDWWQRTNSTLMESPRSLAKSIIKLIVAHIQRRITTLDRDRRVFYQRTVFYQMWMTFLDTAL
jgi:hypothetical protein